MHALETLPTEVLLKKRQNEGMNRSGEIRMMATKIHAFKVTFKA